MVVACMYASMGSIAFCLTDEEKIFFSAKEVNFERNLKVKEITTKNEVF